MKVSPHTTLDSSQYRLPFTAPYPHTRPSSWPPKGKDYSCTHQGQAYAQKRETCCSYRTIAFRPRCPNPDTRVVTIKYILLLIRHLLSDYSLAYYLTHCIGVNRLCYETNIPRGI